MSLRTIAAAKEATMAAVVIRKDGRREDLGVIAYYHINPLRRLLWRICQWKKEHK